MITCKFEDGGQAKLRHVVTDAIVLKDGEVLLVKRASRLLEGGKWGLIGGMLERDEGIVEGLRREILEETGWEVTDVTLLAVVGRPNRPNEDRQNVAFVFFCKAAAKTGQPDDESDEQKWFKLSDLPFQESIAFDHSDSIKLYKRYLTEEINLPILL